VRALAAAREVGHGLSLRQEVPLIRVVPTHLLPVNGEKDSERGLRFGSFSPQAGVKSDRALHEPTHASAAMNAGQLAVRLVWVARRAG